MLVYKITAPADIVQIITPIETKSMNGGDAGWATDVNYFLKLHQDMNTVESVSTLFSS
jgi:hypothetical protein